MCSPFSDHSARSFSVQVKQITVNAVNFDDRVTVNAELMTKSSLSASEMNNVVIFLELFGIFTLLYGMVLGDPNMLG